MKDYNFIQFHKSIDSISEAISAIDKAKMRLIGSVYEADYNYIEDTILHDATYEMECAKDNLKEMKKKLLSLEPPM